MKLIAYSSVGVVGFIFGIVCFVSGRHLPMWARYSFLFFACLALGYGMLGYVLEHNRASLPYFSPCDFGPLQNTFGRSRHRSIRDFGYFWSVQIAREAA